MQDTEKKYTGKPRGGAGLGQGRKKEKEKSFSFRFDKEATEILNRLPPKTANKYAENAIKHYSRHIDKQIEESDKAFEEFNQEA